ncbi:MAG: cytochrome C [Hyphomicrobiales bacterium]|nr:cytochrome C [Hyphomicrobiales bacterium]
MGILSLSARAQNVFERLVMPGPLIEGHAKYEEECGKCHEPFEKEAQAKLCMDCHKEIAADRKQKQGFHGLRPDSVNAECNHCHSEHKGRNADIVQFDQETFDHANTDFSLKGAHQIARCDGCHIPDKTYREAPSLCIDCHKEDEPHRGNLGDKCADCHSETDWQTVSFDHSQTLFELTGSHKDVTCKSCHGGERYRDVSTVCSVCHQLQDVHEGRYGAKCDDCHSPEKWDVVNFNHDEQTKFKLRGKHRQTECDACHKGDLYGEKLATNCFSCHEKDDPHEEQLGSKCETCHNENSWRQNVDFDHDDSRFPLKSLHNLVLCEACHQTPSFKDAATECVSCHEDSFHENRFGDDCTLCHKPNGWPRWTFNHDKQTDYPLTGKHQQVKCHLCHEKNVNARKVENSTRCYSCHADDDPHYGLYGTNCGLCHSPEKFQFLGSIFRINDN